MLREEEMQEIKKIRSEEKALGFSSACLIPAKKWKVETTEIEHPTKRVTQGASIIKDWEDKQDCGSFPNAFMQNKNTMSTVMELSG